MNSDILLFIIKLVASGAVSFLAILLMSKERTVAWVLMVCGFLLSYIAMIYELLTDLGVISFAEPAFYGIPISNILCAVLPALFFIIAFIIMLSRKN